MDLSERAYIVTGAGQGIGRGIAAELIRRGGRVVIAEIDEDAGKEAEEMLRGIGDALFVHTDTSDEASVAAMVGRTMLLYGRIDGLVNNAGIADPASGPVESLRLEDWSRVLATNLTGCFLCVKHCVPHLRERRGAIVNISSTRSMQSEANTEAYSASKGGLDALTRALAVSLGPAIRVNCINPGWIVVDDRKKASQRSTSNLSQQDHRQHPVGRAGTPEDIAPLATFLLSDDAAFITGQRFVVDGGMSVRMIYVDS